MDYFSEDYYKLLIGKYRNKGVIVDTSILLLWFVGLVDEKQIPHVKRLNTYTIEDYCTLSNILSRFNHRIITTPNILTEVSNLAGRDKEPLRTKNFEGFAEGIKLLDEKFLPSTYIAPALEFKLFGLTDAAIACLAMTKYLILTDDLPFCAYLQRNGIDVLNFNHLRVRGWK
jgi:hypothetical protein